MSRARGGCPLQSFSARLDFQLIRKSLHLRSQVQERAKYQRAKSLGFES
jgi:hypothetical protein